MLSVVKKRRRPKKDLHIKRPHFLNINHDNLISSQKIFLAKVKQKVDNLSFDKKNSTISQHLEFNRAFSTKGVQAVVGLIQPKSNSSLIITEEIKNKPMVFKTSLEINRTVEHEYIILEHLFDMRNYCPHFIRSLGMINMPISTEFIYDPSNTKMFDYKEESLPRSVMFLEYANKLPFHRLCDDTTDISGGKNIISSQLIQIMMALEMAQIKKKLTHYDLHTSNVLIQMCEPNSVFLYRLKEKNYLVPTFGFFPLIIDVGSSYSSITEGNPMMTTTEHYHRGLQSVLFDRLNDLHHFLITTFYEIEIDSEGYDSMSNSIKLMLEHLPIMRKSGWKQLPNNLTKNVISRIKDDCKNYNNYEIFVNYDKECLEILNNLIILPLKDYGDNNISFEHCFETFMDEFHKMVNIDDFTSHDILFILREIVDAVNQFRYIYNQTKNCKEEKEDKIKIILKFQESIENRVSNVLTEYVTYDTLNYEKLLLSAIVLSERLQTNYYIMIDEHKEIIGESYSKTKIKSPLDMFTYLGKNLTPHFNLDKDTIVYIWDADLEKNKKVNCGKLTLEELKLVNREYFVNKGNLLFSLLYK